VSDDDKRPFDTPLESVPTSTPYSSPVIDFGDIRIAHGLTRHPYRVCEHKGLTYSTHERRVWCSDCERTIDGFDAFMVVVNHFHTMERAARSALARAKEAEGKTLVRRAAKWLDRVWGRKMLPVCPRCGRGITPEEMLQCGQVSLEYEAMRRKRETVTK
jgi:hypothetical protein